MEDKLGTNLKLKYSIYCYKNKKLVNVSVITKRLEHNLTFLLSQILFKLPSVLLVHTNILIFHSIFFTKKRKINIFNSSLWPINMIVNTTHYLTIFEY